MLIKLLIIWFISSANSTSIKNRWTNMLYIHWRLSVKKSCRCKRNSILLSHHRLNNKPVEFVSLQVYQRFVFLSKFMTEILVLLRHKRPSFVHTVNKKLIPILYYSQLELCILYHKLMFYFPWLIISPCNLIINLEPHLISPDDFVPGNVNTNTWNNNKV